MQTFPQQLELIEDFSPTYTEADAEIDRALCRAALDAWLTDVESIYTQAEFQAAADRLAVYAGR